MSFPRYPAYKDSGVEWLGEVPEHWLIAGLKHLLDLQNGADHKHVEAEVGYPVFGSGGVFAHASDYLYDGESVLLGRKGTIDKPLHVAGRFWAVDTMYWSKVRPGVSGRFGYYAALTIPFAYYSTSTALPSMTKSALGGHLFAEPPLVEQQAIAAFLDRETAHMDALVAEQERLIELLREKRQAVISHAVTKGLDPNVPMKPSGLDWLGDIPAHWIVARLDHLFSQARLPVSVEPDAPYQELGVRSHGRGAFHKEALRGIDLDEKQVYWVQPGALMFNIVFAWEGAVAVTGAGDAGLVVSHRFPMFMPDQHRAIPEFYKHFLTTNPGIRLLDWHSPGSAGRNRTLNRTDLLKEPVPAPPVAEQRAICDVLASEFARSDTLITEARRAITLLQERRAALISAAVTGQIDVRGAADDFSHPPSR